MSTILLAAEIVTKVRAGVEAGESNTNLATLVEGLLERDSLGCAIPFRVPIYGINRPEPFINPYQL